jgi:hypothetical protein
MGSWWEDYSRWHWKMVRAAFVLVGIWFILGGLGFVAWGGYLLVNPAAKSKLGFVGLPTSYFEWIYVAAGVACVGLGYGSVRLGRTNRFWGVLGGRRVDERRLPEDGT